MEQKEYHQLLNTVSKLIDNKKENPIYINFGGVVDIFITNKTQVKVKTTLKTEYFNLNRCDSNLLVIIRAGLTNPSYVKHLEVTLIDPKQIAK